MSTGSAAGKYVSTSDSSAVAMRSATAALLGRWPEPEPWPGLAGALAATANRLPPAARLNLVERWARSIGVDPVWAGEVTCAGLAGWAVDLYSDLAERTYDVILLGSPSGGISHLAALLGAPFLGQQFAIRFRHAGEPDDVEGYQSAGSKLCTAILKRNPDLVAVNHYDPVHARHLVPFVNTVRLKLLDLPRAYGEFIRTRLRPGGTLLYADCQYAWGQYRVGKRHYFQVGGLGDLTDTEYLKDSPDVKSFLGGLGVAGRDGWPLAYPWLSGPEGEWGSLPTFKQAAEEFAAAHGFRFRVLRAAHPEDFSTISFYAAYQAALIARREPAGVLVDSYTQLSPTASVQGGLLPLWLPSNTRDSLGFLGRMSPNFPKGKPVLLAPFPGYSPCWDVPTADEWVAACGSEREVQWIGIDPRAYPLDMSARTRFAPDLQDWCDAHGRSDRPPFNINDLEALIGGMAAHAAGAN